MSAPRISVVLPVLAPTPFLRAMTEFAIKSLRVHAVEQFELIVVEAAYDHFNPKKAVFYQGNDYQGTPTEPSVLLFKQDIDEAQQIDKYLNFIPPVGGVKEINAGIDAASGEFILLTGSDVIAPPGWDAELLRIFAGIPDCGVASLSAYEPNATIGPMGPLPLVVEGMFSPFMMIRNGRGWRFDEAFERVYQDSDLVLRMRTAGLHPYRSCCTHVWHLGSVTNKSAGEDHVAAHAASLARDERLFYERWANCPYATFAMIRGGAQIYGREHEAYTAKINLHYDPEKP